MAKKLFTIAKTEGALKSAESSGGVNAHVVFIEEEGNEGIRAKGKTYQTIPSNGKDCQVLIFKEGAQEGEGKGVWTDLNLIDMLSYGVEWKPNVADPSLTRIGNMNYHRTLPIQSQMKGCIYKPKVKELAYWLDDNDWRLSKSPRTVNLNDITEDPSSVESVILVDESEPKLHLIKKEGDTISGDDGINYYIDRYATIDGIDGIWQFQKSSTTVEGKGLFDLVLVDEKDSDVRTNWATVKNGIALESTIIRLHTIFNGYDGEVMVYVPEFWIRSWDEPDVRRVRVSTTQIDDSWEHQPAVYLAAYRDTVLNESVKNMGYLSTLNVNSAISVANTNTYCRGGSNTSTNDGNEEMLERNLGKCRFDTRANFRTYAREAGKEIMSYRQYKNILYWLWVIEYATFNSQADFESSLDSNGFHQGGMGTGITTISSHTESLNEPICLNGYMNEFGNGTAIKKITGTSSYFADINTEAIKWRGIENTFGDRQQIVDGLISDNSLYSNPLEKRVFYIYTTDDPSKYGDDKEAMSKMVLSGSLTPIEGYIKEWDLGSSAEIVPRLSGGSATQYKCDRTSSNGISDDPGLVGFGGNAFLGDNAGLGTLLMHKISYRGVFRTSCIVSA